MKNQPLINFLNQQLANQFVMYVKLHRYHWFVKGRHFFTLHDLFQKMYEETAAHLDKLAERILMIYGKPLATMTKYVKEATLTEANADDEEFEIMRQLRTDFEQIMEEIKQNGYKLVQECNDKPTEDLMMTLVATYEKYIWMLQAWERENRSSS
ncbi:Dps family protein [Virgibacillus halophilus]|uniref:DNA starvation/stationary phase protection protein n=1 Tax=Tigheibacillus halophilus TaxID=361280 RepID=A0ABU5CB39_9BACI|nr:DNA starvation/stationary phase protection protein [Virgibacillus halophilus]